ncbi:MAG: phosphatase [Ferrovum sp. 37-45-19]|jgi:HAD superfamily hydrolase (TIGR01509 family)|uniref:HAD family hydrolase n=1 Tax=Ferrovum sp. JA12 TaxID=1356299 RepID=UPI000702CCBD|nr:HAD family hydrolase [Ferrovum sp. JA12]OYV79403.1 MAG: phosphatase [Ferrovum sp. 21-44-67]OYV95019.1 MAG: phosphatase [Ferrovum sp. 37-45-19]OZB34259.1 MAG: phosphatase [Ferrovum sp. 34-44-207]HQT80925.1 HAD family hydrolase [Ferrovaceae bacterium]KRH78767.1 phosphorylated carbohydrates phosphatase [Ferrovum sp. JA12]
MVWRAFLFDVDGTLAETERDAHRIAFNQAFKDHQLDWFWDEKLYGELLDVTGGKERIRHYLNNYIQDGSHQSHWNNLIKEIHQTKTSHYLSLLHEGLIPLRPGVKRLLEEARAEGIRLAIVTTTTPDNVIALLENSLGKHSVEWFEVIAAGDVVKAKKPAPDIYLWTLKQLGLKPEECLAIEDSENGLKAATKAAIPTLITMSEYTKHQLFEDALLVTNHLGEPHLPCQARQDDGWTHLGVVDVALLHQLKQK